MTTNSNVTNISSPSQAMNNANLEKKAPPTSPIAVANNANGGIPNNNTTATPNGDKRSFTIVWKNFFNPTAPVNSNSSPKGPLTPLQGILCTNSFLYMKIGKKAKYGSFVQFLSSNNDKRQKKVELQIALLVGKARIFTLFPFK